MLLCFLCFFPFLTAKAAFLRGLFFLAWVFSGSLRRKCASMSIHEIAARFAKRMDQKCQAEKSKKGVHSLADTGFNLQNSEQHTWEKLQSIWEEANVHCEEAIAVVRRTSTIFISISD